MPKQVDHAERRKSIASAAIEVIDVNGLDGMRLRDVAHAADVTTGAVTHYFQDKDAVLVATLDEVAQRILGQFDQVRDDGDLIDAIEHFAPSDEESVRDMRVWLAFWGRAIANPGLAKVHKTYYDAFRDRLSQEIGKRQNAGTIGARLDPGTAADAVIAAIDGIGTRVALEAGDWPRRRQIRTLRLMLEPMLAPPA